MHQENSANRITARAFLALLAVLFARTVAAQDTGAPEQRTDKPAAAIGDKLFYEKDVIATVQSKINELRNQEYQLRVDAVEESVDRYLLKKEAEKRKITEEELLKQVDAKVAAPSQD